MSSTSLQSALTALVQNNYVTVTILSAVGYDYILTFPNEVEYIWSKPWTWVSTLFIFVRYLGLCNFAISALVGSSFLPGPAKMSVTVINFLTRLISVMQFFEGDILGIVNEWAFILFLGAADFVMILRIWAMYNRSRLVFGALVTLFSLEIIFTVLAVAMFDSDLKTLPAATAQILDFSFCVPQTTESRWTNAATILQVMHGAVMCLLAVTQFVRQSLQMYRATKQWQLNRYLGLLVKQGLLSFFAIFLFNLINLLFIAEIIPTGGQVIALTILEYIPIYTLTPRFILSMRELYARDVRGRREGIDTGFGLSLSGGPMAFAEVGQSEGMEGIEEVPMEAVTTQAV